MEPTGELIAAVTGLRETVGALTGALGQYRQPGGQLEEAGFRLDAEDGPAARYLETSARVGTIIADYLDQHPGEEDAAARLAAAITVDAKVAEQAALLAMIRETTDPSSAAPFTRLTRDEIADLGEELAEFAGPLLDEVVRGEQGGGLGPASANPGPAGNPAGIESYVWKVLHQCAEDVMGTAGAALPFAHHAHTLLTSGFAATGLPLQTALATLRKGWHALRRLALKAWRTLMDKLGRWAAPVSQAGAWLANRAHLTIHDLIGNAVGRLLWNLLNGSQIVNDGTLLLTTKPAALSACKPVVKHHRKQRRPVPLLNKTLPVLFTCHPPAGAAAAAVLVLFSIWTAHDHIDSPELATVRIPGNPGLLRAIRASA